MDNAQNFEVTSDLKILQEKMKRLFSYQQSRGGIIDIEAEENKLLLITDTEANSEDIASADSGEVSCFLSKITFVYVLIKFLTIHILFFIGMKNRMDTFPNVLFTLIFCNILDIFFSLQFLFRILVLACQVNEIWREICLTEAKDMNIELSTVIDDQGIP